jgi:hypothetical protein
MDAEEVGHGGSGAAVAAVDAAPAEEPACRPPAALPERHLLPALGDRVHRRPRQALLLLPAVRLPLVMPSRLVAPMTPSPSPAPSSSLRWCSVSIIPKHVNIVLCYGVSHSLNIGAKSVLITVSANKIQHHPHFLTPHRLKLSATVYINASAVLQTSAGRTCRSRQHGGCKTIFFFLLLPRLINGAALFDISGLLPQDM